MSINYRVKKKKRKPSDSRVTLVAQHRKKINELSKLETSLPSLQRELKKINKEKDALLKSSDGFGFIESEKGKKIYTLNRRIREINKTIENIENNKIKDEYYSKTAHILYKYYDNVKAVAQRHHNDDEDVKDNGRSLNEYAEEYEYGNSGSGFRKKRTVIDFLKKTNKKKSYSSTKISDFLDMEEKSNRANLLDSYTKVVHPGKYKPLRKSKKIEIDICKLCEIEMTLIQSEGLVVCPQCGREEHILIDSDKPSYKDPPPEAGEFTYKRINRFDEWLTQYQAKETTEIPQEVLDSILLEMKKEGITNLCIAAAQRRLGNPNEATKQLSILTDDDRYRESTSAAAAWVLKARYRIEDAASRDRLPEPEIAHRFS